MQKLTTDRGAVLRVMERTLATLEGRPAPHATAAAAAPESARDDRLAERFRDALAWTRETEPREMVVTGEERELDPGADYISHHPLIAQVQAAMESFADARGGAGPEEADEVPVDLVAAHAAVRLEGRPPFPTHQSLDDLVYELAPNATVVLVGDFGTAKPRAIRVAQAIRAVKPDHVIHLGDIYPSGTPELAQRHFIDVWRQHGPDPVRTKYWALNGNHEMAAEGTGYFADVLDFCGQRASYFSLQNSHWKLIGLDSAYRDHDLHPDQKPWLHARLEEGDSRNILLTHHQPFSAVDGRPHKNRERLLRTMQEFVQTGRIFGWYFGHEHRFLSYAADPEFGGYLARAVGHGGKSVDYVSGVKKYPSPRVKHYWEVPRPDRPSKCLNGFALLRFAGPTVTISYPDENGFEWYAEIWPDQPH
jgi:3',5'-cyclic AMP phosphodiesterase CpdA